MNLPIETTRSIIKECIVNLTGEELDENKIKLFNFGHKFAPTENRKRPYMDIIKTTEICTLDLEWEGKLLLRNHYDRI